MKVDIKKAFNKKRILIAVLLLALVSVMVISNPEIRGFFSQNDAVKLNFQTGIEYDMASYGKDILLVNNEGIYAVDKRGREIWNTVAAVTSPYTAAKGKYIMLADINGKGIKLFQKEKTVSSIETENEILCAKLNKNGYIAAATGELGYKGMVVLYDKNGKELFKWHSGAGYIGDIDISSKNKIAVAQIMTDKEEVYSKILVISPDSGKDPKMIAEISGIVMKLKYRADGSLVAVSDKGLFGYKRSGREDFSVDFEGKTPISCNIENENNMVLSFDSGLNSTVLLSYSSRGKLRGEFDAGSEIRAMDVNGECIVIATHGVVTKINPKGSVKKEIKTSNDVKDIKIFAGRDKLLTLGDSSAELIRLK